MLLYNLRIALKSLRRNRILSAVIVGGIALGIAVATMFATMRHAFAKDPHPREERRPPLRAPGQLGPGTRPYPDDADALPPQITYRDMVEIMKIGHPGAPDRDVQGQPATSSRTRGVGRPQQDAHRGCASPTSSPCSTCRSSTARAGTARPDEGPEPVVVLDEETNDLLFGGPDSVGKIVRIEDREFRVVGVLDAWRPVDQVLRHHPERHPAAGAVFMPFNFAAARCRSAPRATATAGRARPGPGSRACWSPRPAWIQMWVELPTDRAAAPTRTSSTAYVQRAEEGRPLPAPAATTE